MQVTAQTKRRSSPKKGVRGVLYSPTNEVCYIFFRANLYLAE